MLGEKRRGHGKKRRKQHVVTVADTPSLAVGAEVVVELLGWHTPAAEPLAQAGSGRLEDKNSTPCMLHPQFDAFPYVLVMPPMGLSLRDTYRVAGRDLAMVLSALQQVARRVHALHEQGLCHGDVQQRNVVRSASGDWILCDMGASSRFGQPIGSRTPIAYSPPELARVRFSAASVPQAQEGCVAAAAPSFDVWGFGLLVFELCCGQPLFAQDAAGSALIDRRDRARLCVWHTISASELAAVEVQLHQSGAPVQQAAAASHLIRWCLKGEPAHRPTIEQVHCALGCEVVAPRVCICSQHHRSHLHHRVRSHLLRISFRMHRCCSIRCCHSRRWCQCPSCHHLRCNTAWSSQAQGVRASTAPRRCTLATLRLACTHGWPRGRV